MALLLSIKLSVPIKWGNSTPQSTGHTANRVPAWLPSRTNHNALFKNNMQHRKSISKDPKPANTTVPSSSSYFMQEQRKSSWIQEPKIPELQIEPIIAQVYHRTFIIHKHFIEKPTSKCELKEKQIHNKTLKACNYLILARKLMVQSLFNSAFKDLQLSHNQFMNQEGRNLTFMKSSCCIWGYLSLYSANRNSTMLQEVNER